MPSPQPLLDTLDEVAVSLETAAHVLLFLDFDGTLAPIVASPELAHLPSATRSALEAVSQHPHCTVSIVSGRELNDIRERVAIDGLVYAGNHGLEIEGEGLRFNHVKAARLKDGLEAVVDELINELAGVAGVLVEPKGLSASVHYRRVCPEDQSRVEHAVRHAIPSNHPHFAVVPGKMVWEVRPRVEWNKGTAVRWIREQLGLTNALTMYLGDDRTDEDAFATVGRFVSARVGALQPTRAGYRIPDTEQVAEFLIWLSRVLRFADRPVMIE